MEEKRMHRIWATCYCCLPSLMILTYVFRVWEESTTATPTPNFLLDISDGICIAHTGTGGDSSSMQHFIAKQSCNFLLA